MGGSGEPAVFSYYLLQKWHYPSHSASLTNKRKYDPFLKACFWFDLQTVSDSLPDSVRLPSMITIWKTVLHQYLASVCVCVCMVCVWHQPTIRAPMWLLLTDERGPSVFLLFSHTQACHCRVLKASWWICMFSWYKYNYSLMIASFD